jgi:hypothetical protein
MNNKFLYAGKCFVCLLVHSLLWGCTSLNDAPAESDNAETIITFTMEVGGNVSGTATRANDTWNDSYNEESSTYDSSIDPGDVQVALMDKDGAFVADVTTISCAYEEESGCYRYYGIIDETKQITVGATYRCMVVANAGNKIAFNSLSGSAPTYSAGQLPNANNSPFMLPMWGVASFNANKGGGSQDVGKIYMLRSVAKCRVKLSDALATLGYSLENVKLSNYSSTANLLPGGYASAESTRALTFSGSFNPVDNSMAEAALTLFAEPVTEDVSYICYIPECSVSEDSPVNLTLDLVDANSNRLNFTVKLAEKQINSIIRNHLYDFVVTGISYGSKIEVKVNDWDTMSESWDFSDQISYNKDLNWKNYSAINNDTKTVSLLSGVALEATLNITSPAGALWFASLSTLSGVNGAIEFVDADGTSLGSTVSGEVGQTAGTLRIKSTHQGDNVENDAGLTIIVKYLDGKSRNVEDLCGWTIIQPE